MKYTMVLSEKIFARVQEKFEQELETSMPQKVIKVAGLDCTIDDPESKERFLKEKHEFEILSAEIASQMKKAGITYRAILPKTICDDIFAAKSGSFYKMTTIDDNGTVRIHRPKEVKKVEKVLGLVNVGFTLVITLFLVGMSQSMIPFFIWVVIIVALAIRDDSRANKANKTHIQKQELFDLVNGVYTDEKIGNSKYESSRVKLILPEAPKEVQINIAKLESFEIVEPENRSIEVYPRTRRRDNSDDNQLDYIDFEDNSDHHRYGRFAINEHHSVSPYLMIHKDAFELNINNEVIEQWRRDAIKDQDPIVRFDYDIASVIVDQFGPSIEEKEIVEAIESHFNKLSKKMMLRRISLN